MMTQNKSKLAAAGLFGILLSGAPSSAQDVDQPNNQPNDQPAVHATVSADIQHDESPPLRDIPPVPVKPGHRVKPIGRIPPAAGPKTPAAPQSGPDGALQSTTGPLVNISPLTNFDGVGSKTGREFSVNAIPPDPNGAVGATQYVQWVNESFAIFNKAGKLLYGPAAGNTLWSGFGGPCETDNDGDPIVAYDKAANRWVMTQFAVSSTILSTGQPALQCVAVSTTDDATGSYYRYSFTQTDSNFPDYPKLGVWPDGYYLTFNMFDSLTLTIFQGVKVCAYERANMLSGQPAAQQCFFPLDPNSQYPGVLPADLDGTTPPPTGSPNFLLGLGSDSQSLNLWKFHVDWSPVHATTLSGPTRIPVTAFSPSCGDGFSCIPQKGTSQTLAALGDRLMHRLAYRNFFGNHEALVVNHSVSTTLGNGTATTGVRWYELRDPNGTPTVYQQGTHAPDGNHRWMGSIAMDKKGDIALGYSVSGSGMYPAIRYTGQAPNDGSGQLQSEATILQGAGAQTPVSFLAVFECILGDCSRWGDYTAMTVDPVDDCTFWYTNQYLKKSGVFNWSTRIQSFKFPGCH